MRPPETPHFGVREDGKHKSDGSIYPTTDMPPGAERDGCDVQCACFTWSHVVARVLAREYAVCDASYGSSVRVSSTNVGMKAMRAREASAWQAPPVVGRRDAQ
jgi:hypothetical protein